MREQAMVAAQRSSDQWYAAVEAAGQAIAALGYGVGVSAVGIVPVASSWQPTVSCQNSNSIESIIRVYLAGQAALDVLRLAGPSTIEIWGEHRVLADRLRDWSDYWQGVPEDDRYAWLADEDTRDQHIVNEEIAALLSLFRCQAYRSLRAAPNRDLLESLAERLRLTNTLSGVQAVRFIGDFLQRVNQTGAQQEQPMSSDDNTSEETGDEGVLCPDMFPQYRHSQSGVLRYTLGLPLSELGNVNSWVQANLLGSESTDIDAIDDLDEIGEEEDEEDTDDWADDTTGSDSTTMIQVELSAERAPILEDFLKNRGDVERLSVETVEED